MAATWRTVLRDEVESLDPGQKTMQRVTNEVVVVKTPAGAGKTTSAEILIDYLDAHGIANPSEILVLTFNRSNAAEIISDFVGERPDIAVELPAHNLHQFANALLQEGGTVSGALPIPVDYTVADATTSKVIAAQAITRVDADISPATLQKLVSTLKANGIRAEPEVDIDALDTSAAPTDTPITRAAELTVSSNIRRTLATARNDISEICENQLVPESTDNAAKATVLEGLSEIRTAVQALRTQYAPSSRADALGLRYLKRLEETAESMLTYVKQEWPADGVEPEKAGIPADLFGAAEPYKHLSGAYSSLNVSYHVGREFEMYLEELEYAQEMLAAYRAYERVRKDWGYLDYDDLTYYAALEIAQDPTYYDQYEVVIVDEAQDLNCLDYWIAAMLGGNNVLFTGDTAQTINEFRGSDKDLLLDGTRHVYGSGFHADTFEVNYRSCRTLVEFGDAFRDMIHGEQSYGTRAYRSESPTQARTEESE